MTLTPTLALTLTLTLTTQVLAATPLASHGDARRAQLRELSAQVRVRVHTIAD